MFIQAAKVILYTKRSKSFDLDNEMIAAAHLGNPRAHSCYKTNKPRVMNRWYNGILQGCTNVGGAVVSHSLTSAQCTLCVCAFMAVLSIMETGVLDATRQGD